MKLFLTESTRHLRRSLINQGSDIGRYETYAFADGERGYRLKEDVRGKSAAIIASVLPDPGSLFDLMALHCLLRENGTRERALIIPYLGYARQDRPNRKGEGSIGIMVVQLILGLKASKLILFDLHSERIRRAFGLAAVEISPLPLFADALAKDPPNVIVAPDAGSVHRAKEFANLLEPHPEVATIDKVRPRPNIAVGKRLHGNVRGKNALIVDDMIDTGGTLSEAVKLVSQNGARSIRLAATHGIFSRNARESLSHLPVAQILVTNTLPQIPSPKIRILDLTPLFLDVLTHV